MIWRGVLHPMHPSSHCQHTNSATARPSSPGLVHSQAACAETRSPRRVCKWRVQAVPGCKQRTHERQQAPESNSIGDSGQPLPEPATALQSREVSTPLSSAPWLPFRMVNDRGKPLTGLGTPYIYENTFPLILSFHSEAMTSCRVGHLKERITIPD